MKPPALSYGLFVIALCVLVVAPALAQEPVVVTGTVSDASGVD